MKNNLFITIVVVTIAFFVLGSEIARAAPCTIILPEGSDIQAAIDTANPSDVICLSPGSYSPVAKIDINKSITLQGPQFGVDPRPSAGTIRTPGDPSREAVIDGSTHGLSGIIVIKADGVVLDGLDITGGTGDMIDSETATPTANTAIRYTIVHDSGFSGDEGMQIRSCTNCLIEYNFISKIAEDGINLCCGSTGGIIQFNEVGENSSENAAIYIYQAENTTIQCNLVYDVSDNDGIKLGLKGGGDASRAGGNILNNTVHNTTQDGIAIYMSNTLVEGNEIHHSTSENGAMHITHDVSNITIRNNHIHHNTLNTVKYTDPAGILVGPTPDVTAITINNNNIENNSPNGLTNKAAASIDATNNWWGSVDGPAGEGPGSGDLVSNKVDFNPWLPEAEEIDNPCVINSLPGTSIPALREWGMIVLALILFVGGTIMIRRRQLNF